MLAIHVETAPSKETLAVIDRGLDVYNAQFSPAHFEEFVAALITPDGEIKGGVYAIVWAGMMFVKWLWIDETPALPRQRGNRLERS
jgi:hypothetical protein